MRLIKEAIKSNIHLKGFTLSETLITLAVIGVVFTIATGTLIADINKNQTTVRLEKAYTVISQAFLQEAAKSGGTLKDRDLPETFGEASTYNVFNNILKNNLVISRDCKMSTEDMCNFIFKELDGTEKSLPGVWTRFFLNDGMFVAMQYIADTNYKVIYFYVDTNGKKHLNVVGRDIFLFEYWIRNDIHPEYEGKFLPYGHEYGRDKLITNSDPHNCSVGSNGDYCGALIIKDGWEIKEGYPWAQARYAVK